MEPHLLDNAVWHALTSVHSGFAQGAGAARRYDPEVSVFAAVESQTAASFDDLAAVVGPGRSTVLFGAAAAVLPDGWTSLGGGPGHQMVLTSDLAPLPSLPDTAVLRGLTAADVPVMLALVELAQPGPFTARTIELGGYLGIFHGEHLVAMAGQRLSVPGFTEISAVCTHPDARGRGYAAFVTTAVAENLLARDITPMLHVAVSNVNAQRVYERLGFTVRRVVNFNAVRTPG